MKYRVLIRDFAGMPATQYSEHRWYIAAAITAGIYNSMSPPHVFAFVEEIA